MSRRRLLDSYALLAYLNKEKGFVKVQEALGEGQKSGAHLLMNEINIGETYYILFRKRGEEKATYFLETILPGLPIARVANNFEQVIAAAKMKAKYSLSLADCFAVATAFQEKAIILTGDPEFKKVESLIEIEWILP